VGLLQIPPWRNVGSVETVGSAEESAMPTESEAIMRVMKETLHPWLNMLEKNKGW
jgi:hypothetical protein